MTESYQVLLFFVITVLTIMLVVIGYQIFQILSEVRKMLTKSNVIMNGAVSIGSSFTKSVQNLNGFSSGLKAIFSLFSFFKKDKNQRSQQNE